MFPFRLPLLALAAFAAAFTLPAAAQSFVEDGAVLPAGQVQFEAQGLHALGDAETGAELLIQWSPIPNFELRLGTPSYIDTDFGAGFSDPSIGVKTTLGSLGAWEIGLLASVNIPVGGDLFGGGTADPELLLGAARPLGETTLGGHIAVGRDRGADLWLFGSTLGVNHPVWERGAVYLELDAARDEGGDLALLAHQGLTYGLLDNAQLDAHVGLGLTAEAPDVLLGVGLTVQF